MEVLVICSLNRRLKHKPYQSESMQPSIIEHEISKKGIEVIASQSHLSSAVVCLIEVGCIL